MQLIPFEASYGYFHEKSFGIAYDPHDIAYLSTVNSNEWRKQDHYRILALGHLRRTVTPEQVRASFRSRVLRWHPDKCGGNDHVFKCMTKAASILSDAEKRKAFDSVDPTFDQSIPKELSITEVNFFSTLAPVFDHNAIFSKKQPVPSLGSLETPRAQVEFFYEFWLHFDSWRTFEYLHPAGEGDSDNENRMDKRYKEKQAKAAQGKAKAADNARIRKLIDMAYNNDPRVKAFKAADSQAKQQKKMEKEQGKRQKEAELFAEQQRMEREALEREQADKELRAKEKVLKEAERNAFRGEKRTLKVHFSDHNYFSSSPVELEEMAMALEKLLAKLTLSSQVAILKDRVLGETNRQSILSILSQEEEFLKTATVTEKENQIHEQLKERVKGGEASEWTPEENELLIRAVKLFPGGVANRWTKIAEYLEQHCTSSGAAKTVAQVTEQAEKIKGSFVPVAAASKKSLDPRINNNQPTISHDHLLGTEEQEEGWSKEEQAKLEKAMKMVPGADPQRWDKISKLIPTKSKRQIIERVKAIAASLKKQ